MKLLNKRNETEGESMSGTERTIFFLMSLTIAGLSLWVWSLTSGTAVDRHDTRELVEDLESEATGQTTSLDVRLARLDQSIAALSRQIELLLKRGEEDQKRPIEPQVPKASGKRPFRSEADLELEQLSSAIQAIGDRMDQLRQAIVERSWLEPPPDPSLIRTARETDCAALAEFQRLAEEDYSAGMQQVLGADVAEILARFGAPTSIGESGQLTYSCKEPAAEIELYLMSGFVVRVMTY